MLFTLAALAIATATTPPLAPSGKWVVDYREDMCVLSRRFGAGADQADFAIKPTIAMNSNAATLLVLTPKTRNSGVFYGTATVTLQPSGLSTKVPFVSWAPGDGSTRGYYLTVDAAFGEAMGSASEIDVMVKDKTFALATGNLKKPIGALRTCNLDLFKSWGVDASASPKSNGSPASWFTNADYPSAARRSQNSGRVAAVLTVAPSGKPQSCRVVASSKSDVLDKATCDLAMRRGRFFPFEGPSSRGFIFSVRWELGF